MVRNGRWRDKQVIPQWFVAQTASPTHGVHGLEMRFKLNAENFSHGWELPARLTGERGRSGRGIPADARSKPGSGGQLIAFVPSLDLVVTRQTGSSGEWPFEEYLRRSPRCRRQALTLAAASMCIAGACIEITRREHASAQASQPYLHVSV